MRELKGRISSVHSSQKMTGAMKMISSARKRQVENRLTQARPYQEKLWDIYVHMRQSECDYASPLAEERQVSRVAIVAFASDEGLCGAFNINISKKLAEAVAHYREQGVTDITVIPVGKKILSEIKRLEGIRLEPCPDAFAAIMKSSVRSFACARNSGHVCDAHYIDREVRQRVRAVGVLGKPRRGVEHIGHSVHGNRCLYFRFFAVKRHLFKIRQ